MGNTIESKVVQAILQQADEVTICGTTYSIEQPTLATLAIVSELVGDLPDYNMSDSVVSIVLNNAKTTAKQIARIAAALILGATRIKDRKIVVCKKKKIGRCFSWRKMKVIQKAYEDDMPVSEYDKLTYDIEHTMSPAQINSIITKRLCDMQVGDFFALTASLKGQNILSADGGAEK